MDAVNVFEQYFEAELVTEYGVRKGALVMLKATPENGRIRYEDAVTFFWHSDEEDYAVAYDLYQSRVIYDEEGIRSQTRELKLMEDFTKVIDELAAEAGGSVFWDRPLQDARTDLPGIRLMDVKLAARHAAEGSIVLLKNEDDVLPLQKGSTAAFFGRTCFNTIIGGNGSGAARTKDPKNLLAECEKAGLTAEPALKAFYQKTFEEHAGEATDAFDFEMLKKMVASGLMYEFFGKYTAPAVEFEIPEDVIQEAAKKTDTALLMIGRNAGGEECDRHLEGDYYLSEIEQDLVKKVTAAFPKAVLIVNANGLIDLSWIKDLPSLKGIIFAGIPGEEGPTALARILTGDVTPSGKLAYTIAEKYEDYPVFADFSWDKDHPENIRTYEDYGLSAEENGSIGFEKSPVTLYKEGIYSGYRYFDTFKKEPLFPFGFGLSYTTFEVGQAAVRKREEGIQVFSTITNTGDRAGQEVLQVYVSAEGTRSEHPCQELKGFGKTRLLYPGEDQGVRVIIPFSELACYEEETASWVIEAGRYVIRWGTSSRDTKSAGCVEVKEDIVLLKTENRLTLQDCNKGKIDFLSAAPAPVSDEPVLFELTKDDVAPYGFFEVPSEDASFLTDQELAALLVGYGPGVPFAAFTGVQLPNTITDEAGNPIAESDHPTGYEGYVSPAMKKHDIHSVFYKDGPAGMGETAWPTEMILACSFDPSLLSIMGDAVGYECEQAQINVWLAPALNLQRHPLGGRSFEYYSEDPFLSGVLGCALTKGVQENHKVLVCAKHFAVNEQETYRRGSGRVNEETGLKLFDAVDSVISERAVRELYLKPFEMVVRNASLHCIMTSFNKINGTFAGGSKDLNTHILREEWGFDGCVVTDWGDMDNVVDGADGVAAGNDVIMPGGPPVIEQILKGYEEGRVTRKEMENAVGHLFRMTGFALKE